MPEPPLTRFSGQGMRQSVWLQCFAVLRTRETTRERFIHIQMDELYDRASGSERFLFEGGVAMPRTFAFLDFIDRGNLNVVER